VLGYSWKNWWRYSTIFFRAVLAPGEAWTKDLSWQGRTLFLVLAGLVILAAGYWNSLPLFYRPSRL
jgi:hypothetical protein